MKNTEIREHAIMLTQVVIVGNVAHIGNGSTKRTNGKYFTIVNVFDKAPRGTAAIFNEIMKEVKS